MWVQLTSIQHLSEAGVPRTYHPGDWVNVGKQQAKLWLARGEACLPAMQQGELVNGELGVVVSGDLDYARKRLEVYGSRMQVEEAPPCLPYERTVIWDTSANVLVGLFGVGLGLLDKWELAVPLYDYATLAQQVGSEEDQKKTKNVIRDLRVPLYDTRLIFARRSPDTEKIIAAWKSETGERRLAFLRTIYRYKPFILALPCNWTGHDASR